MRGKCNEYPVPAVATEEYKETSAYIAIVLKSISADGGYLKRETSPNEGDEGCYGVNGWSTRGTCR